MISIDRFKEMALEELETKLNNWKEQVELQSNFIDSLLKSTNNSEWLNKTILDDEASEIIEKIELDYVQLDQLKEQLEAYKMEAEEGKEINAELKAELEQEKALKEIYLACYKAKHEDIEGKLFKLKQTLTEIKEIAEKYTKLYYADFKNALILILQKISEVEDG